MGRDGGDTGMAGFSRLSRAQPSLGGDWPAVVGSWHGLRCQLRANDGSFEAGTQDRRSTTTTAQRPYVVLFSWTVLPAHYIRKPQQIKCMETQMTGPVFIPCSSEVVIGSLH